MAATQYPLKALHIKISQVCYLNEIYSAFTYQVSVNAN